jgi:hypothetical protein
VLCDLSINMASEKQYLVGFKGKSQTALYSDNAWASYDTHQGGVTKMTLRQAKRHLKTLSGTKRTPAIIYKVVPLKSH